MKTVALVLALALPGTGQAGLDHGIWDALLERRVVLIEDGKASQVHYAAYADSLADNPEERRLIAEQKARIRYLDYDWTLNDVK